MKLWKKLTAAVLLNAGVLGAGLIAKPLFPALNGAEITAEAISSVRFDTATGTLTLRGNVDREDVREYASDGRVKKIVAAEGAVLPSNCSRMFENMTASEIDLSKADTANVTYMSEMFASCKALTALDLSGFRTANVTSMSGLCYCCCSLTDITLPDDLTFIDSSAFYSCESLTSVALPDGVTRIDRVAFAYCTGLTDITIPNGVTYIDQCAFGACSSLTSITIPDGVTSINDGLFSDCYSLTDITIPEGVTHIGQQVFYKCSDLTSITIPESVTYISGNAFDGCTGLTICGIAGSYAEQYAASNRFPFKALEKVTSVTLSKTAFPYTGKQIKVGTYIRVKSGTTALKYGTDFTMTYANNVKCGIGTATVTIKGIGNYAGSVTKRYSILPAKQAKPVLSTLNGKLRVSWQADANAQGYQVEYCKNASFTGDTLHSVSFASKTSCNLVTYPKAGEKWYVRVRSYMKNSAGTKHGYWSDASCISLGTIDNVTLTKTEFAYTGKEVKVGNYIRVKSGTTALKYGTDFTLKYSRNTEKGTASVTVRGIGEYAGSQVILFYDIV